MKRPNQPYPFTPGTAKPSTPKELPDPTLDPVGFEQLVRNRGIRFRLFKHLPCPNVRDNDDQYHDPNCEKCDNGFLYFDAGIIWATFSGNALKNLYQVEGIWAVGEAAVTFAAYYDKVNAPMPVPDYERPVSISEMDKVISLDYTVAFSERLEHSFATGVDHLRYPATSVDYAATVNHEFKPGTDFVITEEGYIQWITPNRPADTNQLVDDSRGEVYSISYCYQPVYFVTKMLHELRATAAYMPDRARKEAVRLPQAAVISRDYVVHNKKDKTGEEHALFPKSGGNITPG